MAVATQRPCGLPVILGENPSWFRPSTIFRGEFTPLWRKVYTFGVLTEPAGVRQEQTATCCVFSYISLDSMRYTTIHLNFTGTSRR